MPESGGKSSTTFNNAKKRLKFAYEIHLTSPFFFSDSFHKGNWSTLVTSDKTICGSIFVKLGSADADFLSFSLCKIKLEDIRRTALKTFFYPCCQACLLINIKYLNIVFVLKQFSFSYKMVVF